MTGIAVYWAWFWIYFFAYSVPVVRPVTWESPIPLYLVFSRGLETYGVLIHHSFLFRSSFWINIPCWLLTWPITKLMIRSDFLNTNVLGWRLVLITFLSIVQWYLIANCIQLIFRKMKSGMKRRAGGSGQTIPK